MLPFQMKLGDFGHRVARRLDEWRNLEVGRRLLAKDPTLWSSDGGEGASARLGWLDLPAQSGRLTGPLAQFAQRLRDAGVERAFLVGMGGSSLAPEVFESSFGRADGPYVRVADSTHPEAVQRWVEELDGSTYVIISSKSGTTLETRSLLAAFWEAMAHRVPNVGSRFAAITDPNSPLEATARRKGFDRIFNAPADVGGRFSALSAFGLVPGALSGVDLERLLERARSMLLAHAAGAGPGLELGAAIGELAFVGRDKLTLLASPGLAAFPDWVEQLVAESLGKRGTGVVPIVDEPLAEPEVYGEDRFFVGMMLAGEGEAIERRLGDLAAAGHPVALIRLADRHDLGAEIVRWELAVATAALPLEVQPFDQPDVESSKELTRRALGEETGLEGETVPIVDSGERSDLVASFDRWCGSLRTRDYISIQAFLAPGIELEGALRSLQEALRNATGCATCRGFGPRFLHSTGQLHKGGPNTGAFLQLVDTANVDLPVPGEAYSFSAVIRAQADGDAAALQRAGARVLRVRLEGDRLAAVSALRDCLSE